MLSVYGNVATDLISTEGKARVRMASSLQHVGTIKKALECASSCVHPDKLNAAKRAYDLLSKYADELKTSNKHQHAKRMTDCKQRSYSSITEEEKDAGGVLFNVLYTLFRQYEFSDVWGSYMFLIRIYMDRKEYKDDFLLNLYRQDKHSIPIPVSHDYQRQPDPQPTPKLCNIKYTLTQIKDQESSNKTLQKDVNDAKQEYSALRDTEEKFRTKNPEMFAYISEKYKGIANIQQLQKDRDGDKTVAAKLLGILQYACKKSTLREFANLALRDYYFLVDIHHANLRPSQARFQDPKEIPQHLIIEHILDMARADVGDKLYNEAREKLQELKEKDNAVKQECNLNARKEKWEEMDVKTRISGLVQLEEAKDAENEIHRVIIRAKELDIPGHHEALVYLASLIHSEGIYNSKDVFNQKDLAKRESSFILSPRKNQGIETDKDSEIEFLKNQIEELTSRLSKFATQQLTQGNPNIADLSDRNRPTNIGDRFRQVYDDEWSEAFNAVKPYTKSEEDILHTLSNLIKSCHKFCQDVAREQEAKLQSELQTVILCPFIVQGKMTKQSNPTGSIGADALATITEKYVREYRKAAGSCSVKGVQQLYKDNQLSRDIPNVKGKDHFDCISIYTDKLIECTWYMVIQDPPMHLHFINKGEKFSNQQYAFHDKKGDTANVCVWPVLYLYEGGPIVKKGYVLPN